MSVGKMRKTRIRVLCLFIPHPIRCLLQVRAIDYDARHTIDEVHENMDVCESFAERVKKKRRKRKKKEREKKLSLFCSLGA